MKKVRSKHISLELVMLVLSFSIQALITLVFNPIQTVLISDIAFANTIIPDLVRGVIDLLDTAAMTVGFSLIAVAFFMRLPKAKLIYIYACSLILRQTLSIIISLLFNGTIEIDELLMSVSVLFFDAIALGIAILIARHFSKKYLYSSALQQKASLLFNDNSHKDNENSIYPFKKIYSRKNPLQSALLAYGIFLSAVKIFSRTVGLVFIRPDILITVSGYVTDILVFAISYAFACFLLSKLYSKNESRKAMEKLFKDEKNPKN